MGTTQQWPREGRWADASTEPNGELTVTCLRDLLLPWHHGSNHTSGVSVLAILKERGQALGVCSPDCWWPSQTVEQYRAHARPSACVCYEQPIWRDHSLSGCLLKMDPL